MTALGRLHLTEAHGLTIAKAVPWLERGVEAGHAGAMEELGRLYAKGTLVPRNLDQALTLARRGADQGHQGSESLLNELEAQNGPA